MDSQMHSKVVVVTGAGSGIGQATAILFAQAGAKVVVSDIGTEHGEATVSMIEGMGGVASFVRCDVAEVAAVKALIETTIKLHGRLDYAFNNAGIEGTPALTGAYPEEVWTRVIAVNLTGVYLCMRYELEQMAKQGYGAIVNNASILGTVGFPTACAYVAAKHGVLGLTKTAAAEYAAQGIRVNAVCPGFIETPMLERGGIHQDQAIYDMIVSRQPIGRLGRADEVARLVRWLCSDEASFVTGSSVLVDGGYTTQ